MGASFLGICACDNMFTDLRLWVFVILSLLIKFDNLDDLPLVMYCYNMLYSSLLFSDL